MALQIDEFDVLTATAIWLKRQGWDLDAISISRGGNISPADGRMIFPRRMREADVPLYTEPDYLSDGPDIVASRDDQIWKIECKGHGAGARPTLFNQFQRAVGSVVSYLDGPSVQLGLALPEEYLFNYRWGYRLPIHFRIACRLHFFAFDRLSGEVTIFSPDSELPPY